MENVRREDVHPLAPEPAPPPDPYRVLFPLGAALAVAGVAPWIVAALRAGAYPGPLHAALMMEGFELAFVSGFLLTAMPAFTHGARARRWELLVAALGVALDAAASLAGLAPAAHATFAATVAFLLVTVARRVRPGAAAPPEEFALVGAGLVLGIAGGLAQALVAAGAWREPAPRLAEHAVSLGMVLSLVLGLGGLLVPTFTVMKDPLAIAGVARAGERPRRRAFVLAVAAAIAGALACEAAGLPRAAAWLRAAAALASGLLAWKLWRRPGRPDRLSWTIWSAGWAILAGLLGAAIAPEHALALEHVTFVGGYGLLTLGIATRVVASHGGHGLPGERAVLAPWTVVLAASAVVPRLAVEWGAGPWALAAAAALWATAWLAWLARAWPRVARTRRAPSTLMPAPRGGPPRS